MPNTVLTILRLSEGHTMEELEQLRDNTKLPIPIKSYLKPYSGQTVGEIYRLEIKDCCLIGHGTLTSSLITRDGALREINLS